jgi:transposase
MSRTTNDAIATLGIDIGKNVFHLIGLDRRGAIVLPRILAATGKLSPRMIQIIQSLADDWRRLDHRINETSFEVEAIAKRREPPQPTLINVGTEPL